ncbi:MAG TPA: hypothetical protein VGD98_12100 [Ktedonobacteraceae bacterium]
MNKRLRFGLVIGAVIVVLAIIATIGGRTLLHADSGLPADNCTADAAFVNITINNGHISSSISSFSPGVCYGFIVTNSDKQAYDFLIVQPGSNTVLAAATNIASGGSGTVDYKFAVVTSETPINITYTAPGDKTPLGTEQLFLAQ